MVLYFAIEMERYCVAGKPLGRPLVPEERASYIEETSLQVTDSCPLGMLEELQTWAFLLRDWVGIGRTLSA